jgi:hypothetical protein
MQILNSLIPALRVLRFLSDLLLSLNSPKVRKKSAYDESLVVFAPDTPVSGEWFYQAQGTQNRVPLGEFFELQLVPSSSAISRYLRNHFCNRRPDISWMRGGKNVRAAGMAFACNGSRGTDRC